MVDELKNIDLKYYCSNYYDASVNNYGVKCGASLRFWEKLLIVNLMIILFHLKLDKFYCIGDMN